MSAPDPKPPPRPRKATRKIDRDASAAQLLRYGACCACGAPACNAHHVIPKGQGGDDVLENLVSLCGSGTARCHGALHGNPYDHEFAKVGDVPFVERRDAEWVLRRIGAHLLTRPEVLAYVATKKGPDAGAYFLQRRYYLTGPVLDNPEVEKFGEPQA